MSFASQRPPAPLFTAACCAAAGILIADQAASLGELCLILPPAALAYALTAPGRLPWLALLLLVAGSTHYWTREFSPARALSRNLPHGDYLSGVLTGTVLDVPQARARADGPPLYNFLFRVENADNQRLSIPGAEVLVRARGEAPRCGERLRLRVALRQIPPARNPGQPDLTSLWTRRGIWVEAFLWHPQDVEKLSAPDSWQPRQWAAQCRMQISDLLARGIETQPLQHALIASMVLGVRGTDLREAETWFRKTGTLHLFAVSGLNLTMLAWLLCTAFRALGAGPRTAVFLTLPLLAVYAFATGLGPSCLRALVGTVLLLGSVWVERPSVAYNSIGAAALFLFLIDTNNLFQAGFQLSFCLVLALLWVATPLGNSMARLCHPDPLLPRKLWTPLQRCWVRLSAALSATVAASLVSFAGSLPWSYMVFHLVSPVGVAVNLVVIPLAFGILSLGLLSVFSAPFGFVAHWVNSANALLAGLLLNVVRLGSSIPGGHWAAANPFATPPDFVIFDAGDGAAVLLDLPDKPWLLDCGSEAQFVSLLLPGLRFYGVNRLEGLALSHGDAAHIGGALATHRTFRPHQFVDSTAKDRSRVRSALAATLDAAGHAPRHVEAGHTLQQTPAPTVEILHPPRGVQASLADDKCLVVRFHTERWSLLYTADAGYPTERWLLEHNADKLQADVWVRGNHVREPTGTDAFVQAVNPRLIVVAGSPFGRDSAPLKRWAEQWRERGRTVWLQQETGAVEGWAGEDRRVRGFLNRQELRW